MVQLYYYCEYRKILNDIFKFFSILCDKRTAKLIITAQKKKKKKQTDVQIQFEHKDPLMVFIRVRRRESTTRGFPFAITKFRIKFQYQVVAFLVIITEDSACSGAGAVIGYAEFLNIR